MNTPKKTACVYCGLPFYGKGCRFAPNGIHVHPTPDRCMYCGLKNIGHGCRFAPHGIHVRFGDFGFIQSENMSNSFLTGYMLNILSSPIELHDAFILGIVNEEGKVLREPVNEQERAACTDLEMTLIDLKRRFGGPINSAINERLFTHVIESGAKFDQKHYENEVSLKEDIAIVAEQFYNIINSYKGRLSTEEIDKCIVEGFVNDCND